ncbi:MAG: ATP-binding cassette domain-containing protein [Bacteroidales bacterium]|nr:ATP-binding cassette domain-containing protein [Bacteroidales bacterium]
MIELSVHKKLRAPSGEMQLSVDINFPKRSFVCIYGKSGSGKTTLFKIISGIMQPDRGQIVVNGKTWLKTDDKFHLKPQKRKVGFVFQDYALFPNMTVLENLEYGLEKGQSKSIIDELIGLMELGVLADRKPDTISGGQKQRVALARALVQKPEILLLDEPLSALDHEMRIKLQEYILKVHQQYELTTLLISHDVSEILKMADTLYHLDDGKIIRQGKPVEVFTRKEISGKLQLTGEVVAVEPQDFMCLITVLIGNELAKVVVVRNEKELLKPGDKVLIASKAFNPVVKKIG